jgi:hypothetical protein
MTTATKTPIPPAKWEGPCRSCHRAEARDREVIVAVVGVGWWHRACFDEVLPDAPVEVPTKTN